MNWWDIGFTTAYIAAGLALSRTLWTPESSRGEKIFFAFQAVCLFPILLAAQIVHGVIRVYKHCRAGDGYSAELEWCTRMPRHPGPCNGRPTTLCVHWFQPRALDERCDHCGIGRDVHENPPHTPPSGGSAAIPPARVNPDPVCQHFFALMETTHEHYATGTVRRQYFRCERCEHQTSVESHDSVNENGDRFVRPPSGGSNAIPPPQPPPDRRRIRM